MNRKKRIETILNKNLSDYQIDIVDNSSEHIGHNNFDGTLETHFQVELKKIKKNFDNRLTLHRKINHLLNDEFLNGLHALEIKIKS